MNQERSSSFTTSSTSYTIEPFRGTFDVQTGQPIPLPQPAESSTTLGISSSLQESIRDVILENYDEDKTEVAAIRIESSGHEEELVRQEAGSVRKEEPQERGFILEPFTGTLEELLQHSSVRKDRDWKLNIIRDEKDGRSNEESLPVLASQQDFEDIVVTDEIIEEEKDRLPFINEAQHRSIQNPTRETFKVVESIDDPLSNVEKNQPELQHAKQEAQKQEPSYQLSSYTGSLDELIEFSRPIMVPFSVGKGKGNVHRNGWWSSGGAHFYSISGVIGMVVIAGMVIILRVGVLESWVSFGRTTPSLEKQVEETGKKSTKRKRRRKKKSNKQHSIDSIVLGEITTASRDSKRQKTKYEVSKRDDPDEDTAPPLLNPEPTVLEDDSSSIARMETIVPNPSMESDHNKDLEKNVKEFQEQSRKDSPWALLSTTPQDLFQTHVPALAKEISKSGLDPQESLKIATHEVLEMRRQQVKVIYIFLSHRKICVL